jgi:hypothetical protein
MTYPPQGPYGQQPPDPYQQGPYQQQQQPYQQQPPWAAGPPGGFPMGPPPKKSRTGLIASLIIVAILVVGGVGLYFLLNKDDPSGSGGGEDGGARAAADTYIRELETALNTEPKDADLSKLEPVTCGEDFSTMTDELEDARQDEPDGDTPESTGGSPDELEFRLVMKGFKETSGGAAFTMDMRLSDAGDENTATQKKMTVAKDGGDWKVCGLYEEEGDSPPTEDGPGQAPSGEVPPNPFPPTT